MVSLSLYHSLHLPFESRYLVVFGSLPSQNSSHSPVTQFKTTLTLVLIYLYIDDLNHFRLIKSIGVGSLYITLGVYIKFKKPSI